MKVRDASRILDLPEGADDLAISAAFRRLSMIHHPDRGGETEKFHEITAARDLLIAENKKPKTCPECQGDGEIVKMRGFTVMRSSCIACGGTGKMRSTK